MFTILRPNQKLILRNNSSRIGQFSPFRYSSGSQKIVVSKQQQNTLHHHQRYQKSYKIALPKEEIAEDDEFEFFIN